MGRRAEGKHKCAFKATQLDLVWESTPGSNKRRIGPKVDPSVKLQFHLHGLFDGKCLLLCEFAVKDRME